VKGSQAIGPIFETMLGDDDDGAGLLQSLHTITMPTEAGDNAVNALILGAQCRPSLGILDVVEREQQCRPKSNNSS
jgi:hypothetical protein